jgi:hypothetical protein
MDLLAVGIILVIGIGVAVVAIPGLVVGAMFWWLAIPVVGGIIGGAMGFFFGVGLVVILFVISAGIKEQAKAKKVEEKKAITGDITKVIEDIYREDKYKLRNAIKKTLNHPDCEIEQDERLTLKKLDSSRFFDDIGINDEMDYFEFRLLFSEMILDNWSENVEDVLGKYDKDNSVGGLAIEVFVAEIVGAIEKNN